MRRAPRVVARSRQSAGAQPSAAQRRRPPPAASRAVACPVPLHSALADRAAVLLYSLQSSPVTPFAGPPEPTRCGSPQPHPRPPAVGHQSAMTQDAGRRRSQRRLSYSGGESASASPETQRQESQPCCPEEPPAAPAKGIDSLPDELLLQASGVVACPEPLPSAPRALVGPSATCRASSARVESPKRPLWSSHRPPSTARSPAANHPPPPPLPPDAAVLQVFKQLATLPPTLSPGACVCGTGQHVAARAQPPAARMRAAALAQRRSLPLSPSLSCNRGGGALHPLPALPHFRVPWGAAPRWAAALARPALQCGPAAQGDEPLKLCTLPLLLLCPLCSATGLRAYPFLAQVCRHWRAVLGSGEALQTLWSELVVDVSRVF